MTEDHTSVESILAIDCGSTMTRAHLIGRVEGEYRLVAWGEAPSTLESPWSDTMISVRQALNQLSEVTGWRLLDDQGQIISPEHQGSGVDAVVATTSASEPLRLVLTGISQEGSLSTAQRILSTSYALVEGLVRSDRRAGDILHDDVEGQVRLLQELAPDAIVMVGGVDGGGSGPVLQSARTMALACSTLPTPPGARPLIIYAGNAELQSQVTKIVGASAKVRVVDNVRPGTELENPGALQAEIEDLHRQHKLKCLPGFDTLEKWSSVQVVPTARTFARTIQYLAQRDGINVLGVDMGGATTTVATVIDGQIDLAIHPDLGLSHSAARILDHVPIESVVRWLPFEMDPAKASNALCNKAVYHRTLPQTRQDLFLEQAAAREALRLTLADKEPLWQSAKSHPNADPTPSFHLIVGGGGVLAKAPDCSQAALILLDALQPVGISKLALDKIGLLAPSGAVAALSPLAAAQVMDRDALLNLGTVVAPVGTAREGETALTCRIEYADGHSLEVEVAYGSLDVIPLPTGQAVDLEIRPTRRFGVGLETRGQASRTRVEGGTIGIIIDARGRPLPIAIDPGEQQERMQRWLEDIGSPWFCRDCWARPHAPC